MPTLAAPPASFHFAPIGVLSSTLKAAATADAERTLGTTMVLRSVGAVRGDRGDG